MVSSFSSFSSYISHSSSSPFRSSIEPTFLMFIMLLYSVIRGPNFPETINFSLSTYITIFFWLSYSFIIRLPFLFPTNVSKVLLFSAISLINFSFFSSFVFCSFSFLSFLLLRVVILPLCSFTSFCFFISSVLSLRRFWSPLARDWT